MHWSQLYLLLQALPRRLQPELTCLKQDEGVSCLGGGCYLFRRIIIIILVRHLSSINFHSSRLAAQVSAVCGGDGCLIVLCCTRFRS